MKSDWEHLSAPVTTVTKKLLAAELPTMAQVTALATWTPELYETFNQDVATLRAASGDRSNTMQRMAYEMAENAWSDEQIFTALHDVDDRWGKYAARSDRESRLTDMVDRARAKVGYRTGSLTAGLEATIARLEAHSVTGELEGTPNWVAFRKNRQEIVWLLEGLVPVKSAGLIVASPGTGKTQLMMNLGADMACGRPEFLTWRNMGQRQHRVLFLSFEMGTEGVQMFMDSMDGAYQEPEDQRRLERNFFIEAVGDTLPMDIDAGQKWFESKLTEVTPDIVLIDSLSMIVSKEMTDEVAMKDTFKFLKSMREQHGCAIVIVHHDRKQSTESKKEKTTLDDVYGSRFISANVDYALYLNKITDDKLTLSTLKNRYARADHKDDLIRTGHLTFTRDTAGIQAQLAATEKLAAPVEEDPFTNV